MKVSKIDELYTFEPDQFSDHRGIYIETFNKEQFKKHSDIEFIQDDISKSTKGVFRGLHGDGKTWKLVSCIYGEMKLIIVNCNQKSAFFGKKYTFNLSVDNYLQVLIPPFYANGHQVLSEEAIFNYKQSSYYGDCNQFSINISSPILGKERITDDKLILSQRDSSSAIIENNEDLQQLMSTYN